MSFSAMQQTGEHRIHKDFTPSIRKKFQAAIAIFAVVQLLVLRLRTTNLSTYAVLSRIYWIDKCGKDI